MENPLSIIVLTPPRHPFNPCYIVIQCCRKFTDMLSVVPYFRVTSCHMCKRKHSLKSTLPLKTHIYIFNLIKFESAAPCKGSKDRPLAY